MLPTIYKLEEGSARSLISKFDVKQRVYFGNTSMESEISLLMANQTLVRVQLFLIIGILVLHDKASPGKFVYDPFFGTGSTAYVGSSFFNVVC
jgi:tRNA (guanine10-N2)-methyltransferase